MLLEVVAGDNVVGFRGRVGRVVTLGLSLVSLGMVLFVTGFAGLLATRVRVRVLWAGGWAKRAASTVLA